MTLEIFILGFFAISFSAGLCTGLSIGFFRSARQWREFRKGMDELEWGWRASGEDDERRATAAWLRQLDVGRECPATLSALADAVERGEHTGEMRND